MKKVLVLGLVLGGLSVMTSCKKDYTCTYNFLGTDITVDYDGLNKDEAKTAEDACDVIGGTWATK
ncbi:hypothetical protein N8987_05225 [Crocinitomix sp.]|nr:hypothetical protein [Crocinitomix sp.]